MSEPTPEHDHGHEHGGLLEGTVKVPGGGRVKKGWAAAGIAVVGVAVVFFYRNKKTAAPATPTDPAADPGTAATPSDVSNFDPTAGGAGVIGYDSNGNPIYGVGTGQQVDTGPPFSTNAAWAQYAVNQLVTNGYDGATVTADLGMYLAGGQVNTTQRDVINAAIAMAGFPPVAGAGGKPPAINLGGTSGGNPVTNWKFPAPTGLVSYEVSATGYRLKWNPVTGPNGQHPSGYTVATYDAAGHEVNRHVATQTSTAEYGPAGHGLAKGRYHSNVWANGGPTAPPHSTAYATLTK